MSSETIASWYCSYNYEPVFLHFILVTMAEGFDYQRGPTSREEEVDTHVNTSDECKPCSEDGRHRQPLAFVRHVTSCCVIDALRLIVFLL